MRLVRYVFLGLVGLILVIVALANRQVVTLGLVPDELAVLVPIANTYSVPLFLVIFGSIVAGLLLGFVWEYFREHKIRADSNRRRRDVARLEREVKGLREKTGDGKDDVLALLE